MPASAAIAPPDPQKGQGSGVSRPAPVLTTPLPWPSPLKFPEVAPEEDAAAARARAGRLVWKAESERARLEVVCHQAQKKIREGGRRRRSERSAEGKEGLVAEYNERKKEAIQEFREGGKDQEWLKDEVEGLVRELQSAIEPVRVAVVRVTNKKPPKGASKLRKPPRSSTCADGDGNQQGEHREEEGEGGGGMNVQQGKVKSRKGMMSLSVSSPCDNQATIVGPASAARYDALCNALDATSKASGSYTVQVRLEEGEARVFNVDDYVTISSLLRVMAGIVVGDQGDKVHAQHLIKAIKEGESVSHGHKWGHTPGARYCADVAPIDQRYQHVRGGVTPDVDLNQNEKSGKGDVDGGVGGEGGRGGRDPKAGRVSDEPVRDRALNSATKPFPVPELPPRVRYMCAHCGKFLPHVSSLSDHECTCRHCGDPVQVVNKHEHMGTCRNRPYTCPRCGESEADFYGEEGSEMCRSAWVTDHDANRCIVRMVTCEHGCGATFMPGRPGEAEEWIDAHVCPVECAYCDLMFVPGPEMEDHVAQECVLAPVQCEVCLDGFLPSKEGEGAAWLEAHKCAEGLCSMCKQVFPGVHLERHSEECPCRPIDCPKCMSTLDKGYNKRIKDRDTLLEHHVTNTCPMRAISCAQCEEVHEPSTSEDREAWLPWHAAVCPCREAVCGGCGAVYRPKKKGQRERWIETHETEKCPLRPIACASCGARSVNKFRAAGERDSWLQHHMEAVCVFRPAKCERCHKELRSKDASELESWRNTHRCSKEEKCKWCKETVHTLSSPYEHRRAALFNDHSEDDVMSLQGFLEVNRFVGVLATDPPSGHQPAQDAQNGAGATCYRVMNRTVVEKAFVEVAGCGSLRESVAAAVIEYAQFRDAVASLDTVLVDGPMKAHRKVCTLKPIRCDACRESYQPTRPGGAEKWLAVHRDKSCPLRPVTCKACELVFVPQVAGQIEEWMLAHPKVCPARKATSSHKQKGALCMCEGCLALRKPAKTKFKRSVDAWLEGQRRAEKELEPRGYEPPPEGGAPWVDRLVVEGKRGGGGGVDGPVVWELRSSPSVAWDSEAKMPAAAMTPVKAFRLDAGRKAERMREERLERIDDDETWVKEVKIAENPVPKCVGTETITCGVCCAIHTVTRKGKRTKMWQEGHMGVCRACGETSMCSKHKCRPQRPATARPRTPSLQERSHQGLSMSGTATARPRTPAPTAVLIPSFLGAAKPVIPSPVSPAYFESPHPAASSSSSPLQKAGIMSEKEPTRSSLSFTPPRAILFGPPSPNVSRSAGAAATTIAGGTAGDGGGGEGGGEGGGRPSRMTLASPMRGSWRISSSPSPQSSPAIPVTAEGIRTDATSALVKSDAHVPKPDEEKGIDGVIAQGLQDALGMSDVSLLSALSEAPGASQRDGARGNRAGRPASATVGVSTSKGKGRISDGTRVSGVVERTRNAVGRPESRSSLVSGSQGGGPRLSTSSPSQFGSSVRSRRAQEMKEKLGSVNMCFVRLADPTDEEDAMQAARLVMVTPW